MKPHAIVLPTYTDERGILTVVEREPFEVKRVFWIYEATRPRGQHSHKEGEQLIIAVHGTFVVRVDSADGQMEWKLANPAFGIYLPPEAWVELDEFSEDAVCLVLCSHYYERGEHD